MSSFLHFEQLIWNGTHATSLLKKYTSILKVEAYGKMCDVHILINFFNEKHALVFGNKNKVTPG